MSTPTRMVFLEDAYWAHCEPRLMDVEQHDDGVGSGWRVSLDHTIFYATSGGQPHDTGFLSWPSGRADVLEVRKQGLTVWHYLGEIEGSPPGPADEGKVTYGEIDWQRRYDLMRTHTALHVLCGVIWHEWGVPVTGGNMQPLSARMDFELDPTPEGFGARAEELVAAEIAADRPIEVSSIPRGEAVLDEALIRTKVSLVPESVREIRVVDIVGLDKQADGGTHVARTGEVGTVTVVKTESKGKGNKRVRIALDPREAPTLPTYSYDPWSDDD
jgi:misacylated tRNA(Ala) deacylase